MAPIVLICEPGRTPLRLQLGPDPVEVGRHCSGLILTDSQISRRHLELRRVGDDVIVIDLGSTNGSRVDDARLVAPHRLRPGEVVTLGASTITLLPRSATPIRDDPRRATSIERLTADVLEHATELGMFGDGDQAVTVVFSDIEDSTRRAVALGDERWLGALQVHNAIIRRFVAKHGGREVKNLGDGFMLAFPSARAAILAMIDVQRAVRAHARSKPIEGMSVRVGIHTGEAMRDGAGDLFGRQVTVASGIATTARGDEILVSPIVHEIAGGLGEIAFGETRTVTLKGIAEPQTVHVVEW